MSVKDQAPDQQPVKVVEERGPWPFVTWRVFRALDGSDLVYSSRHHRKGLLVEGIARGEQLGSILRRCLWMPGQLNWWIGIIFAMGALLFAAASGISLAPSAARALSLEASQVNAIYFLGSIPFTMAAYLQLFQAANAGDFEQQGTRKRARVELLGWAPHEIGWLSCMLQFVGTFLFNVNTFDAMMPSLNWFQQDVLVWAPNIIGSTLFLLSGYLAFIETCHAHWAFRPNSISWWVVMANLIGCVCFMISALLAIVLPSVSSREVVHLSIFFTGLGAIGFFIGSLLMLPETIAAKI